jgi:APA family basic amino acid/polyamine antiporter
VPLSHWEQGTAAIVLVLLVSAVNIVGTRWSARVQNVTTVIKVSFLLFLIVGPFLLAKADTANLTPLWPSNTGLTFWQAMGVAMIAVMWPYDGWINIGQVAEEIREPQRNVPLALTVGMLIVIALYAGANVGYHLVLPMAEVARSPAVAAEVTERLLGNAGAWVAALGVMFSTLGALNSNLLAGPRIYFAMSRDNLFPAALQRIHSRFRTPANAIAAQTSWSVALLAAAYAYTAAPPAASAGAPIVAGPGQAFDHLTDFVIFGGSIFYAMAVGAVFVLRWQRPSLPRPYRTWGYPFTPALYLIAFAAALVSMFAHKWQQSAVGLVIIAAGIVFFFVWNRRKPS